MAAAPRRPGYAVRFVPRKPGSTWSPKNRRLALHQLAAGRIAPAGLATLPRDLEEPDGH